MLLEHKERVGIKGYHMLTPKVPAFDKSISHCVPKDEGKHSFMQTVIKAAKEK